MDDLKATLLILSIVLNAYTISMMIRVFLKYDYETDVKNYLFHVPIEIISFLRKHKQPRDLSNWLEIAIASFLGGNFLSIIFNIDYVVIGATSLLNCFLVQLLAYIVMHNLIALAIYIIRKINNVYIWKR